ncbi:FUSC family protein [Arthrobacter rhombi]|uniref:FUSC family protein n=1 Tax=Arthrobacter rhombi TaxID=71253 RepID=UPI003FD2940D
MDDSLTLRRLLTLGPGDKDPWIGVRCGLGVFLPLAVLLGLDRLDLAIFAIFGAFTGIFGRVPGHRDRLRSQASAGVLFVAVIGAAWTVNVVLVDHASPAGGWVIVGLTTLVAWACSLATGFAQLRPAGSLFHIFCFAAIASIPEVPGLGVVMATAIATVTLSVVIGQLGRISSARRTPWNMGGLRPQSPRVHMAIKVESIGYLVAAGLAGTVALLTAPVLSTGHPYWAMVAAVVPLVGHTTRHRIARGLHRVLGTLAGLGIMALIIVADPNPWTIILFLGLAQFGAEMLITRNYFWAQVCVTPLALVGTALMAGMSTQLLYDRILETVIGSVIGVAVALAGSALRRRLPVATGS